MMWRGGQWRGLHKNLSDSLMLEIYARPAHADQKYSALLSSLYYLQFLHIHAHTILETMVKTGFKDWMISLSWACRPHLKLKSPALFCHLFPHWFLSTQSYSKFHQQSLTSDPLIYLILFSASDSLFAITPFKNSHRSIHTIGPLSLWMVAVRVTFGVGKTSNQALLQR